MAAQDPIPSDSRLDVAFNRAFEQLKQLVDFDPVDEMFPVAANGIYTTALVLWMLVYQRMSADSSVEAAIKKMIEARPVFLRPNKRIENGTFSTATGGDSRARTRMPLEAATWPADGGFGIFRVAFDARQTGHEFLLRMTKARFGALRKKGTLLAEGENGKSYSLTWRPSAKERKNDPDLPPDAALDVRLHEIVIHDGLTLYLVTDLMGEDDTPAALAGVYRHRYDIEIDIRNLKVVLDTETIRARSVEMFQKELLASVVTYNLVTPFRRQAADLAELPPRRMSFKRTWTTFGTFLLSAMFTDAASWRERYRLALSYAIHDKLPSRPGRSYERESYSRRPKSAEFKKRKSHHDPPDENPM